MKDGDVLTGTLGFVLVIAGIGTGIGTAVSSFFQGLPWEVPVAIFLILLFYGLCRASYEEVREAGDKVKRVERERDGFEADLQEAIQEREELRQENETLIAETNTLKQELAVERASIRSEFSQEELANRRIEGRSFHIMDLARNDAIIRGWTFEGCDILGPAVVAPFYNTYVDELTRWAGDKPENVNWEVSSDREFVGAIGLDGCIIRRSTFIRVGWLAKSGG